MRYPVNRNQIASTPSSSTVGHPNRKPKDRLRTHAFAMVTSPTAIASIRAGIRMRNREDWQCTVGTRFPRPFAYASGVPLIAYRAAGCYQGENAPLAERSVNPLARPATRGGDECCTAQHLRVLCESPTRRVRRTIAGMVLVLDLRRAEDHLRWIAG